MTTLCVELLPSEAQEVTYPVSFLFLLCAGSIPSQSVCLTFPEWVTRFIFYLVFWWDVFQWLWTPDLARAFVLGEDNVFGVQCEETQ
jgi:hypothetical protein